MMIIFGVAGADCPNAGEAKALAMGTKNKRIFSKKRNPRGYKLDRIMFFLLLGLHSWICDRVKRLSSVDPAPPSFSAPRPKMR